MSKYLLLGLLIVGIAVGTYIGCDGAGARMGVAKDAAIKRIDDLLGPLNVKQKEVENAFAELKDASAGIRDKRIEAQVRLKALTEKKASMASEQTKLMSDLGKLKQMLTDAESTGSITKGDKEISVAQLKSLADSTMKKLKSLKDRVTKNDVISAAWAKNLDLLKKNDETSAAQLKKLGNQLDEIKSKKSALDAMKEAATIAGPGASISDKFNDLTKGVDELLIELDTEWEIEKVKIDERIAEVEEDSSLSLEDLLHTDDDDVTGTISEIDSFLNGN